MFFKVMVILLLSLIFSFASADECALNRALSNPNLAHNNEFWQEYSEIQASDSDAVSELLKKYGALDSHGPQGEIKTSSAPSTTQKKSASLEIDRKAVKEIENLPSHLKGKVDEFITAATKPGGILEIRNNPGRWRLEKLTNKGDVHTVRLNGGYRIQFTMNDSNVHIQMVNKDKIHDN